MMNRFLAKRTVFWVMICIATVLFTAGTHVQQADAQAQYCRNSQHDPTRWHPAVDPVSGCLYGHEHGANPQPAGSPFGPLVIGGDESTPNENFLKHNAYKVQYIHRSNPASPAPTADPCDDVRVRMHFDSVPNGRGRYHSYEVAVAHCRNGQIDVSYLQGWIDFGTVVSRSVQESADTGTRPMIFAPSPAIFQTNGLNIWETWYGRTGLGLDMGWLMGEVPALAHDNADPQNPNTWTWTGGEGRKRKIENFNFYGWRETRRGEFYTDVFGNTVDRNSEFCRTNQCLRQYISPLFGTTQADQIVFNLQYDTAFDTTGVDFPRTYPLPGPILPWDATSATPVPTTPAPTTPPVVNTPVPTTPPPPAGAAVRVDVTPATAAAGSQIAVALNLFNVTGLYGLQAECSVNPAVLQGTTRTDGDAFSSANSFFVDSGYKPDGKWTVAASRLQPNTPFSGNGRAFTLNYNVLSAGSTTVNCSVLAVDQNGATLQIQVINGSFSGNGTPPVVPPTSTPAPTNTPVPTLMPTLPPDPVITPEPAALGSVSGRVTYQNRPNNAGITVKLLSGTTTLAEVVTTASGEFSFTNVQAGSYTVQASAPQHLLIGRNIAVTNGQNFATGSYSMPAGDTDNNGKIDVVDATFIGANFGVQAPPAPASADLNGDGNVNVSDLVLVGGNFNRTGPVMIQ